MKKRVFAALLILVLGLAGCAPAESSNRPQNGNAELQPGNSANSAADANQQPGEHDTNASDQAGSSGNSANTATQQSGEHDTNASDQTGSSGNSANTATQPDTSANETPDTQNAGDSGSNYNSVTSPKTLEIKGPESFDLAKKTVLLNSGYEIPVAGLGTYSLDHDTCVYSVMALIKNGGRLIDTAYMYHNEAAVGEGVRRAMAEFGVPREDIFVTTKLYPNQFSDAANAIDLALKTLDIGYIDLLLLHHPGAGDVEAYKAMEQAVADGKVRSIGLSNWYIEELTEFLPKVTIPPALVQNEIHPFYQEPDVVPFIQEQGIVVQGWYPFGGREYTASVLGDETLASIAAAHGVSVAQVILRWNLQRGVVVIPGSSNPEHIKENLDIFGFELTEAEMKTIATLNRDEKHDWY